MSQLDQAPPRSESRVATFIKVAGPGLVVMLADTDVGSLVTAGQSGAKWGYSLVYLQILLIPILYIVQELTARLGTATGRGHGELILERYGPIWAWISFAGLFVAGLGAIITEFSGIAGIGDIFGISRWFSLGLPVVLLLTLVFSGSHSRIEWIAVVIGVFELAFVWVAFASKPDLGAVASSIWHAPVQASDYRVMIAANIGAVIMPWMIFYQQSSVADKGLEKDDVQTARWDTLAGAIVSQIIMSAVLIAAAATIGHGGQGGHDGLKTVGDLAGAFTPSMGPLIGKVVFGVGVIAAAGVSLTVVSLALAWGFGDVTGVKHSLGDRPTNAPVFYAVFAAAVIAGAVAVQLVPDLITLNIGVEVANALLLPLALGLLLLLATRALPEDRRLKGAYKWMTYAIAGTTILFGFVGALSALGLF